MKTQTKQQGFTLIELMIVVTIIGILASIAIPAYRDYTIRTRVGECASVYSPVKTESAIYYSENGQLADDLAQLAGAGRISGTPGDYAGDYVSAINYTEPAVDCVLQTLPELGDAAGGTLTYTASTVANTINWSISSADIDPKFWPSQN